MKVSADVLAVLDRAETDGNALRLIGQLDRQMYATTNKVLELAGGKWNRKARAHLFAGDAADAIEAVILTGEITDKRQEFGFFPTPEAVARQVIDLARIEDGMYVLEPSAGQGALAIPAARAGGIVDCVEIQDDNARVLTDVRIYRNMYPGKLTPVMVCDFLTGTEPRQAYDRVVMNPPFTRQDDVRHVLHAFGHVKPGGRLVAVMSNGVTFRDTPLTREFRALMDREGGEIHTLPEGAFKESGTGVRTVIAVLPKAA